MTRDTPVMSSRTWSERLGVRLPDPLLWDLYELIVEAEFLRRMGDNDMKGQAE